MINVPCEEPATNHYEGSAVPASAALTCTRRQKRKYVQLDVPLPYGSLHDHRRYVSHSSGHPVDV